MPVLLLDKETAADLSKDEFEQLKTAAEKLVERVNCSLNLVMELDSRYRLEITEAIQTKKVACVSAQTTHSKITM